MSNQENLFRITPQGRRLVAEVGSWGIYETVFTIEKASNPEDKLLRIKHQPLLPQASSESNDFARISHLRQLLVRYFSESELKTLCFDLNIDYGSLSSQNKTDKVRELILYLYRNDLVSTFTEFLKKRHPEIEWG